MKPAELLARLRAAGVEVLPAGERLRLLPQPTPELLAAAREYKVALLVELRHELVKRVVGIYTRLAARAGSNAAWQRVLSRLRPDGACGGDDPDAPGAEKAPGTWPGAWLPALREADAALDAGLQSYLAGAADRAALTAALAAYEAAWAAAAGLRHPRAAECALDGEAGS